MMIAGDTLINYKIKNFKRASEYKPLRHRGTDQRKLLDQFNKNFNLKESSDIISKLYDTAKRDSSKIELYQEAIYEAIDTDPVAYIKSINKIIPSSVGLNTLYEFVYTNGISILSYRPIVESIESCIDKYNSLQKDASLYNEALEFMESFKNTYRHNFYMFENFSDSLQPNYIEAYYKNFPVLREGKEVNFAKMIERFGESVIPDMLVYASMFGNPMNVIMPFKERYDLIDNTTKLWLEECEKDVFMEGLIDTIKNIPATIRSGLNIDQPEKDNDSPSAPPPRIKSYTQNDLPSPLNIITKNIIKDIAVSMKKFILEDPQFRSIRDKMTFKNIDYAFDTAIEEFQDMIYDVSCPDQIAPGIDILNLIELSNYTDGAMEFDNPRDLDYDHDIAFMDVHGWFDEKLSRQLAQKIFDVLSEKYNPELNKYGMMLMNQKMIDQHPYIDVKNFLSGEYDLEILIAICPTSEENAKQLYYSIFNQPSSSLTENSTWNIIHRNERSMQESVILGEEKEISFTESELESIQDLISFKENLITLVESEEERMQLQREVYTLYESAGDLLDEDVADSVIPMLPGANQNVGTRSINEDWLNNTHNKKTGSMPDYLKNAHDLNWGEDDDAPPKKRPSASDDDKPDDDDLPSDDKKEKDPLDKIEPFDYDSNKSNSSDDKKDDAPKSSSGHIQNYYYYTYNNSNNTHSTTNTNSYNQSRDDHSRNKRTRSHDYAAGLKEEKQIWELDVPEFDSYQEGFLDSAQKVLSTVSRNISTAMPKNRMQTVQEYDSAIFQRKMIIPEDKVPKQIIRKTIGEAKQKNKNESVMYEDVLDDQMPKSDNPIQDTMLDLDRKLSSVQQSIKSKAQGVQRTASAIAKPFKRTSQWIGSMIARWKDANENEIKAKMADPHERSGLLSAFKSAVKYGSLMKAGLLLNPIFMFLSISRKWSNRKNTFRIRNEMIGELKAELEIIEEKIRDADHVGDRAAKYKLMRFRNELKKKLIRVGGTPEMKNMI